MNFQLFDNFKEAAKICNLEVVPGPSYFTINIPNTNRYVWCWTPLNKIEQVMSYYDDKQYEWAINFMKDNKPNFHLEIDSYNHLDNIMEVFCDLDKHNLTTNEIIDIIHTLQDDEKLAKRRTYINLIMD